jgi:antitoxin MazE
MIYNVDTMALTISRWGNSLAVRLPKALLESAGLHEGDEVVMSAEDGQIVLRPATTVDLDAMLSAITSENLPDASFDWAPVGRELL